MPKRNVVWILIGGIVAALLWKAPEALIRRDALYRKFGPLLDVRVQVLKHYVEELDDETLLRGAIDGMLDRLDPYSEYYTAAEYDQFAKRTQGQFYGIGIEAGKLTSGEMVVICPIEGSPAFQAGMRARDRITHIDGAKTTDLPLEQGVERIKGPPGTYVTLTIRRPGLEESFDQRIQRALVTVPSVRGWARTEDHRWDYLIDPRARIGYARILSFEATTAEQLDAVVQQLLHRDGMRALVLDVRDDPGGLLEVVAQIVNRFVPSGKIVSTKRRNSPEQVYRATPDDDYPNFPVVVLINQGSASAAEILAGSLKDQQRAVVVGEQSFGKGSVQETFEVENEHGVVKLTTGYYILPNGERIHGKGVTPDVVVQLTAQELTELRESQIAVYGAPTPTTTQAATSTAPAPERVEVLIDRQLRTALDILRRKLASAPAGK